MAPRVNSLDFVDADTLQAKRAAVDLYKRFRSYSAVGAIYGRSGGYAWFLVNDPHFFPSPAAVQHWQAFERGTRGLTFYPVRIYAIADLPPGTVILGTPRRCEECKGLFIFPHPAMKTCSPECKKTRRRRLAAVRRERQKYW